MENRVVLANELELLMIALGIYVSHVHWIRASVDAELRDGMRFRPPLTVLDKIDEIIGVIRPGLHEAAHAAKQRPNDTTLRLEWLPFLKRCYLYWRRKHVRELQARKIHAVAVEYNQNIDAQIKEADAIEASQRLADIEPYPHLRFTDFLTLQRAEELLTKWGQFIGPPPKLFHDKFPILSPSRSVVPSIQYWREQCDLRNVGFALAYMDIDNFKRDFNSKFNETLVDLVVLPVIMRYIEAHCFHHASAFLEGGDEFVVLVPNTSKHQAVVFLDELRNGIKTLKFHGVDSTASLSIGLCHVDSDSSLTDFEIQEKANEAKKLAKTEHGKDCIVAYEGKSPLDPHPDSYAKVGP